MTDREYLEERSRTLHILAAGADAQAHSAEQIELVIARLRELVGLGTELLVLLEPAGGDAELGRVRGWLSRDLEHQKRLLALLTEQLQRRSHAAA